MKPQRTPYITTALLLLSLVSPLSSHATKTDETVLAQVKKTYLFNERYRDATEWRKNAARYAAEQTAVGTWNDIDYTALNSLDFAPKAHLSRAVTLSEAYATPNQPFYRDRSLLPKIKLAFDYWVKNDFRSYNWWHNEIGTQQYLLKIILLLGNDFEASRVQNALPILNRTEIAFMGGPEDIGYTGQNLMWRAEIQFVRSLLTHNEGPALDASKAIESLLTVDAEEGMQSDGSFLQHGPLIYNGGYGDKFVLLMSRFFNVISGSKYDFKPQSKQRFLSFVVNSQIWLTRNNKYDFGIMGRSIAIKNRTAINLAESCQLLENVSAAQTKILKACSESILNGTPIGLSGHRSFFKSDFALQQSPEYLVTFRMYSSRTLNNDAPSNGEGLMSHHLADGAMLLQKDGNEYENIFPVWDWNKIPGTTVEQKQLIPAQFVPGRADLFAHIRYFGRSDFVGSITNGRFGASTLTYIGNPKYDKLRAKKSWFNFQNAIWSLGTDIQCANCSQVLTTLNQTLSKTAVSLIDTSRNVVELEGSTNRSNLFGFVHQNVGYVFPKVAPLVISHQNQSGDWHTINSSLKNEMVTKKVVSASIDHGKAVNDGEYAYLVLPEASVETVQKYRIENDFEWINTPRIQAVHSKMQNLTQLAFHAVAIAVIGSRRIEVSQPGLVMIEPSKAGLRVTVSDPTQKLEAMKLRIDGVEYSAQLPQGERAGASAIARASRN